MKKEFRRIKKLSKGLVSREHHKKLKKIKDIEERTESLKYLVASILKLKALEIESKLPKKRSLLLDAQLSQLKAKIRILETSHSKKDYELVKKAIEELESEVKKCLVS